MFEERTKKRQSVAADVGVEDRQTAQILGRVINMTATGLRLYGGRPLTCGQSRKLKITVPAADGLRRIDFDAKVVWSRRDPFADFYDSGLQMEKIAPEDQEAIEAFAQFQLSESR